MAYRKVASFSPSGIELYQSDASPNGVIVPLGLAALCFVQLAGSVALWQCTALPSTWVNLSAGGSGVPLSSVTASLASTSIDNGAFTETWAWSTATTQNGLFALTANALTSGKVLAVSSTSAAMTGSLATFVTSSAAQFGSGAVQVQGSGAYTGALMQIDTSTLTGTGLLVNADALTGGSGLSVISAGTGLTGTLGLFQSASTSALGNGAVRVRMTGAHTGSAMQVDTATATGVGLAVNANALTTGVGLSVVSTGTTLTGNVALFQSGSTSALNAGAVRVRMTAAHTGAAMQIDSQTQAGQLLLLTAGALTTGTMIQGTAAALTTGSMLDLSTSSVGFNSTNGLLRVANTTATVTGILARFQSNSTAGSGLTILGNGNVGLGTATPVAGLHNAGSTLLGTSALGNFAAGGPIGAAAATVDVFSSFTINQTTAGQTLTLPNPTDTTAGRLAMVYNIGSQSFTIYGVTVTTAATPQTAGVQLGWNGTAWVAGL